MKDLENRVVGVLMGGRSCERDISLRSGRSILDALLTRNYEAYPIVLDTAAALYDHLRERPIDVIFNALHGEYGEDGCVQGVLECLGIPYTGSDVLCSAMCMDKWLTKTLFTQHGIAAPKGVLVDSRTQDHAKVLLDAAKIQSEVFVKPRHLGSTVAAGPAGDPTELSMRIQAALSLDSHALIEERIIGTEVSVGLLGHEVLGAIEIVPQAGVYDYKAKYTSGDTSYFTPPRLSETLLKKTLDYASRVQRIVGARSSSRVDMIVREDEVYVLEINTSPGMTPTSLVPRIANAKGLTYAALCERILQTAQTTMPRQKPITI